MKKLLIVLFGMLIVQGHVFADSAVGYKDIKIGMALDELRELGVCDFPEYLWDIKITDVSYKGEKGFVLVNKTYTSHGYEERKDDWEHSGWVSGSTALTGLRGCYPAGDSSIHFQVDGALVKDMGHDGNMTWTHFVPGIARLITIVVETGTYKETMHQSLSKQFRSKYKKAYQYGQLELEKFNAGELGSLYEVYKDGQVAVGIYRHINSGVLFLDVTYRDEAGGSDFLEDIKGGESKASDF